MKAKIYILGCLLTTVINSFAQESQTMALANNVSRSVKNSDIISNTTMSSGINVEEKVSKAFESSFGEAEKIRWYEKSRKNLVKFILNEQEHIALFNKNGSLFYHISYGYEKDLPVAVKAMVKDFYPNYNITKVIKINQNGRNFWVLNMENHQYFKIVNVEGDKMKEMNHFRIAGIAL